MTTTMPPNHSIRFWMDKNGNLTAEVEGVHGQGCSGLLDILKDIGIVQSEENTADWDKPDHQGRSVLPRTSLRTNS